MRKKRTLKIDPLLKSKKFKNFSFLFSLFFSVFTLCNAAPNTFANNSKEKKKTISPLKAENIKNWGLFDSQNHADIQALQAWNIEKGKEKVLIGVIDTGIDFQHKNLIKSIFHDPAIEKNTIPTCPSGWDFVSNQPNPKDNHGHGTHIAGIIGATTDLNAGISGVSHHILLLPLKYYSEKNSGTQNLKHTVEAIEYAIKKNVKIINYSGGGPDFSQEEFLAIKKAQEHGILFVTAAGNEHENTDQKEHYYFPSAYHLSNIISVAATNNHNQLLPSSNWGKKNVDVTAPGENIYSTLPDNHYGPMSGTSQATAFVTGIAALLLSEDPTLTPEEIKEIIIQSVDSFSNLKEKISSGGRVNAYKALMLLKTKNSIISHHLSKKSEPING